MNLISKEIALRKLDTNQEKTAQIYEWIVNGEITQEEFSELVTDIIDDSVTEAQDQRNQFSYLGE